MFRAALYLFFLSVLFLAAGVLLGGRQGLLIAFLAVVGMNILAYFYSRRIILWTYSARPLEGFDPYGVQKIIEKLCKKTGLPKPSVFLIPAKAPNALALGRNVTTSSIVLTEGAIQHLSKDELEAILAHSFAQIQNRDTFVNEVSATLGSVVMYIGLFFSWIARSVYLRFLSRFFETLFAPFSALLVQGGLSKNRHYFVDSMAVEISSNPQALAGALWKMEHYGRAIPMTATLPTAHLFIVNPLEQTGINKLFQVHPVTEERVKKLTGRIP